MRLNDFYCMFHSQIRLKMEWEEGGGRPEFSRYLETFTCTLKKIIRITCALEIMDKSVVYAAIITEIF